MPLDYSSERLLHKNFVGREALLAALDHHLVTEAADRWVVVTGGPGMGKSALLSTWLERREAKGDVVPHHFIRRGVCGWDNPAKLVGSLVAQIEERFPDLPKVDANEEEQPVMRLARTLLRVSKSTRLVLVIDGLDEYEPPAGSDDPFAAILPPALPVGIRLLCATRRRNQYIGDLQARASEMVWIIDLDDPASETDNNETVGLLWEQAAQALELDTDFVDKVIARSGGNLQHAVQLWKYLAALPRDRRRIEDIPPGHAALLERPWRRIAADPAVVTGLGVLCAAREALTLDELGAVAGWIDTDTERRWMFERAAKELLWETRRSNGVPEYRIHNDSTREYIAQKIGESALRAHHATLAQRYAIWPNPRPGAARRYALRHAPIHRGEAGDWTEAWRLAADIHFLEAQCRELGVLEAEADVAQMAELSLASDRDISRRCSDLARAIGREARWLQLAPEAAGALLWNRLRRLGWSTEDLDEQLRVPADAQFLRVRHAATHASGAQVRELGGHADVVTACAVTANGQRLISASEDKTLRVWNLETGRTIATLRGHTSAVLGCAMTADGQRAISTSEDGTLRIWDLESGCSLASLHDHDGPVQACAMTPNGKCAVSASGETLKVWDLEHRKLRATLKGHAGKIRACALTRDGRHVISASHDRSLRIWDLETSQARTLEGHADAVTGCSVTDDGRHVISASWDETLKIWDLETGRLLHTLEGHTGWITACAVAGNNQFVVSASIDRTLKLWDLISGRALATLEGHADRVRACAVTHDGRRIISASDDWKLKVWDIERGPIDVATQGHTDMVMACAVTADGHRVVSASQDRTLKVWDPSNGRVVATLEGHSDFVMACAVTPDGQFAVSASRDRTLKIWDLANTCVLATLEGHSDTVMGCTMTADLRYIVSASADETLRVWDRANGNVTTLRGHTGTVMGCAITPDGTRVVSASADRTLKVWDLKSGHVLATLNGHTGTVVACAITPDGKRVISASSDATLKVWDLDSAQELRTLCGHTERVWACIVTPDGRYAISASSDQTLRVWHLETYSCLFIHRGDARFLAVAATATTIIAGDQGHVLWLLDWPRPVTNTRHTPGRYGGRDIGVTNQRAPEIRAPASRSIVAVIGIDRYTAWQRLENAVRDAEQSVQLLCRLGFEEMPPRLLDKEATRDAIHRLVTSDLGRLAPDDSLVVFFAGHGHTVTRNVGGKQVTTGYIIPVDGELGNGAEASWLRIDNWLRDIAQLPPRHILVLIDACHSGVALTGNRFRGAESPESLEALQSRISRRVITSALDDQRAADSSDFPGHSLFTGFLIEGLSVGLARSGARTHAGRPVATGRDIAHYLHKQVSSHTQSAQTPDYGEFDKDERGDIVIPILDAEFIPSAQPHGRSPGPATTPSVP